jgi:hypothetical protein
MNNLERALVSYGSALPVIPRSFLPRPECLPCRLRSAPIYQTIVEQDVHSDDEEYAESPP